jgi:ubiquinone/menaquinone biosynthesis C-methylase UbiE
MLSAEQAVQHLRADPRHSQLIYDSYLDENVFDAADRFLESAEFSEVMRLLGGVGDADVLDLGSGRGIGAYAFAKSGSRCVHAVEPDSSTEVGRGAIELIGRDLPIRILDGVGEQIPLPDQSVDLVYGRQVFHHAGDLEVMTRECARVTRHGGLLLACREHVVNNERQLERFLENHPVHPWTGQEYAFSLERYLAAFAAAGFEVKTVLGPWDSIINAFPAVRSPDELSRYPVTFLGEKLGTAGKLAAMLPGIKSLVWAWLRRPVPGRMYSFLGERTPRSRLRAHPGPMSARPTCPPGSRAREAENELLDAAYLPSIRASM